MKLISMAALILMLGQGSVLAQSPREASQGFAVVELYTSEGCSSCPPAEKLSNRLVREAESQGLPVYVLAYHVDYWDGLGWRDRYGKKEFSERQRAYAKRVSAGRVYTPMMVINGEHAFVGHDEKEARALIKSSLQKQSAPKFEVTLESGESQDTPNLTLHLEEPSSKPLIWNLAWVEGGLETKVKAGENQGRRLHHENVVREYLARRVEGVADASATLRVPSEADLQNLKLISWLHDPSTGKVLSATSVPVSTYLGNP